MIVSGPPTLGSTPPPQIATTQRGVVGRVHGDRPVSGYALDESVKIHEQRRLGVHLLDLPCRRDEAVLEGLAGGEAGDDEPAGDPGCRPPPTGTAVRLPRTGYMGLTAYGIDSAFCPLSNCCGPTSGADQH